jgi:hypothetical protein
VWRKEEEPMVAITFGGEVLRAASVGEEGGAVETGGEVFPSLPATLNLIGFRVMRWGVRLRRTSY